MGLCQLDELITISLGHSSETDGPPFARGQAESGVPPESTAGKQGPPVTES